MQILRKVSVFWKSVFLLMMIAVPSMLAAQDSGKGEFYGSVDLSSKHLWRAIPAGEAPMVKPEVGYSKGDFYVYLWGAWDFEDTYREVNIGLGYTLGNLTFELLDYFIHIPRMIFLNWQTILPLIRWSSLLHMSLKNCRYI